MKKLLAIIALCVMFPAAFFAQDMDFYDYVEEAESYVSLDCDYGAIVSYAKALECDADDYDKEDVYYEYVNLLEKNAAVLKDVKPYANDALICYRSIVKYLDDNKARLSAEMEEKLEEISKLSEEEAAKALVEVENYITNSVNAYVLTLRNEVRIAGDYLTDAVVESTIAATESLKGEIDYHDDVLDFVEYFVDLINNNYTNDSINELTALLGEDFVDEEVEAFENDELEVELDDFFVFAKEVSQAFYDYIMEENPSFHSEGFVISAKRPVENVSFYDAVYFCNVLSDYCGFDPVYYLDGSNDVEDWNYTPHCGQNLEGELEYDEYADGYRLPTVDEWNSLYSEDAEGWFTPDSLDVTHECASKAEDENGLYDMNGNVWEWCWDYKYNDTNYRAYVGGGCRSSAAGTNYNAAAKQYKTVGLRVIRNKE